MVPWLLSTMCVMGAQLFYVNEPVVDMREEATENAKVVSQALFAEKVEIGQEIDGWYSITTPDGYSGWIPSKALIALPEPYMPNAVTNRLISYVYGVKDTEYGPIKTLPYGSPLFAREAESPRWVQVTLPDGVEGYIQRGDIASISSLPDKQAMVDFSVNFLGLPYRWGGRSSFGYDCSGFVQMLYRRMGVQLQRDSKQQILDDRFQTIPIEDLEPGDLIFFGRSAEKINHVGMYVGDFLGKQHFIHATVRENQPWIRVSRLTDPEWSGQSDSSCPYRVARRWVGYIPK